MKNESTIPVARGLTWMLAAVGAAGTGYLTYMLYLSVGASLFFMSGGQGKAVIATIGMLALCYAAALRVAAPIRMHKAPDAEYYAQTRKLLSRSLLLSILGVLPFVVYLALFAYSAAMGSTSVSLQMLLVLVAATYLLYIPVMLITRGWKIKKISMQGTGRTAAVCALAAVLVICGSVGYVASMMVPVLIARSSITAFQNFEAVDMHGESVTQEILAGKVTIVNVWETTCGPCRQEMPDLEALSQKYAGSNVQIVGVCFDLVPTSLVQEPHPVEEAVQILEERGVTYCNLVPGQALADQLNGLINAFPTTFIVDESGKVLEIIEGSKDEAGWELVIQQYLK